MKKNYAYIIACLALVFLGNTVNAQNTSGVKAVIQKTNDLYFEFFKKKDTAIVGLYTDDACLMPSNTAAIRGKAALSKDFKDTYDGGHIQGVKFSTTDVYGNSGVYVTEEGNWQVFDANGNMIDSGKYLKLWKKTAQGWKIFRDIFNSDKKGS